MARMTADLPLSLSPFKAFIPAQKSIEVSL
jgi:hypothetical protein